MNANHCPYCATKLVYRGIDADIDTVTEQWWCPECKERTEVTEPGLRNRDTEQPQQLLSDNEQEV